MATDAIITLERLVCIREVDGTGHSEPYIWPLLIWIDDTTLALPQRTALTRGGGASRNVLRNDMRAGQAVAIPPSTGVLRARIKDGFRRLILVVSLWERDEMPEAAVHAGFQAFPGAVQRAIVDNLVALSQASGAELEALITAIKDSARAGVESAITGALTSFQKFRIGVLGTLNPDDIVDSDFAQFRTLVSRSFSLRFGGDGEPQAYEIQGNLVVRPVPVERCPAEAQAVTAAEAAVKEAEAKIGRLRDEFATAAPAEREGIRQDIAEVQEEELRPATAALEKARRALQVCREALPSPVLDSGATAPASPAKAGALAGR
ncbi:MAG TPA: hypothetical protein VFZ91_05415 [Allosphingosinicella sp.]